MVRTEPVYCTHTDVADWLGISINANTDPSTNMIKGWIMDNEDKMDRSTNHTWMTDKQVVEEFNVNKLYDWGRGQPLFPRKRNLKTSSYLRFTSMPVKRQFLWVCTRPFAKGT